jgi:hypothetical protein
MPLGFTLAPLYGMILILFLLDLVNVKYGKEPGAVDRMVQIISSDLSTQIGSRIGTMKQIFVSLCVLLLYYVGCI